MLFHLNRVPELSWLCWKTHRSSFCSTFFQRSCVFAWDGSPVPVTRLRGGAGTHTGHTRDTRAHKGTHTGTTQTNLTTIQTHQQHTTRTTHVSATTGTRCCRIHARRWRCVAVKHSLNMTLNENNSIPLLGDSKGTSDFPPFSLLHAPRAARAASGCQRATAMRARQKRNRQRLIARSQKNPLRAAARQRPSPPR